ncbi:hypothetical protein [Streptomyces sp. NPDC004658]|uniref:hypothetical protein n=1 Tax=Streptomyces sp. NPDC004658 TaxID=3154672 RepID=UPI0033AD174A
METEYAIPDSAIFSGEAQPRPPGNKKMPPGREGRPQNQRKTTTFWRIAFFTEQVVFLFPVLAGQKAAPGGFFSSGSRFAQVVRRGLN